MADTAVLPQSAPQRESETQGPEHFDVLIVGAGLSGIGAGYHLQTKCPGKTFVLLESRQALGGTWDLFRYPGVRSDSDMYTLGYNFRPWVERKAIADGPSILKYIQDTARENGIDRKIRYGHRITQAAWSSPNARWTVDATGPDGFPVQFTCNFLYMCTGYYNYEQGYLPDWPGIDTFRGTLVHPQKWPEDLDYKNKRVVVIGSGATAVTLVPAMAESAAHVTMLQRSPTYIVARPAVDPIATWLHKYFSARFADRLVRWTTGLCGR
jgi:monooxygenase